MRHFSDGAKMGKEVPAAQSNREGKTNKKAERLCSSDDVKLNYVLYFKPCTSKITEY